LDLAVFMCNEVFSLLEIPLAHFIPKADERNVIVIDNP
jgi:hypothetical protein